MGIPRWVIVVVVILLLIWAFNDPHGCGLFFHHIGTRFMTFVKSVG